MALSVSYWSSPMEKLILHLSPVARRRTLKNSNQSTNKNSQSLGRHYARHRNRSEPQSRVSTSMKNVSNIGACNSQAQVNLKARPSFAGLSIKKRPFLENKHRNSQSSTSERRQNCLYKVSTSYKGNDLTKLPKEWQRQHNK